MKEKVVYDGGLGLTGFIVQDEEDEEEEEVVQLEQQQAK